MENKEKKTSAVELNDEKLENVSGGEAPKVVTPYHESLEQCDICGYKRVTTWYKDKNYCSECMKKEGV